MKRVVVFLLTIISLLALASCKEKETLKLVAPSGAPALSNVKLFYDSKNDDNFNLDGYNFSYELVGASSLPGEFTNKEADFIVAPINVGVKLAKTDYKYVANVTEGNIYFVSKTEFTLNDLSTRKLAMFGEGTINEVVVKAVLKENNIEPSNLEFIGADTQATNQALVSASDDTIYLVAEPVLSASRAKLQTQGVTLYEMSVKDLFKDAYDLTFLQAGVFAKSSLSIEVIDRYLVLLEESVNFVNNNKEEASEYATALELGLPAKEVLVKAIPGASIHYLTAKDAKDSLEKLVSLNPSLFGGSKPDESFYY